MKEQNGRPIGNVERVFSAEHGDVDRFVAYGHDVGGNPVLLVAQGKHCFNRSNGIKNNGLVRNNATFRCCVNLENSAVLILVSPCQIAAGIPWLRVKMIIIVESFLCLTG